MAVQANWETASEGSPRMANGTVTVGVPPRVTLTGAEIGGSRLVTPSARSPSSDPFSSSLIAIPTLTGFDDGRATA